MASVMLHNVDLGYDGKAMVHQVNLSLASGELGCLLGPSGCGKSTLLRSIAGFTPLLGGQILLDKTVVADENRVLPPRQSQGWPAPRQSAVRHPPARRLGRPVY